MVQRISGFASGMDIDTLVSNIMTAKRAPLDKLKQKQQTLQWQRENFRDINLKLVEFRKKTFDNSLASSFQAQKSTVTGDTNAVTAKASSQATSGSISIEVTELAKTASVSSTTALVDGSNKPYTASTKLTDAGISGTTQITINGSAITITADETISSLVTKINQDKGASASAYYDEVTGKLSITSKTSGKINGNGKIAVNGDGNFTSKFNFADVTVGDDAQLKINGIATTRSSNSFNVNGIDITLNAKTTSPSVITTSVDTDQVIEKIKSFISDYNDLLSTLNTKVKEKHDRNFTPLTEDQKKAMKDDEVEKWEEKAKTGLLYNDSILNDAISKLRSNISSVVMVNGEKAILDQIGITTGQWFEGGKLILKDESKLREAIEQEPDKVAALITSKNKGMYDDLKITLDSLTERAGTSFVATSKDALLKEESTIGRQLKRLSNDILNQTRLLNDMETRYYKQFTAMETTMNKFQSQSSSFSNFG
ncbi:flagellar filament capping protein FliD [Paenibacillus sp. OAS669]|uniref:flagellar filament capping protein FliD n=1 Tax=Paenibacillus sp. OAS669 TaxID=2663821 RepID=UPI00178A1A1B|nr:flagellar filament capping protein FliD [Paenibacillus sp. OAS669]MBE1447425.1 flagellar hook-associated protein 2 [Paenibacillus sp. OAS669]